MEHFRGILVEHNAWRREDHGECLAVLNEHSVGRPPPACVCVVAPPLRQYMWQAGYTATASIIHCGSRWQLHSSCVVIHEDSDCNVGRNISTKLAREQKHAVQAALNCSHSLPRHPNLYSSSYSLLPADLDTQLLGQQ